MASAEIHKYLLSLSADVCKSLAGEIVGHNPRTKAEAIEALITCTDESIIDAVHKLYPAAAAEGGKATTEPDAAPVLDSAEGSTAGAGTPTPDAGGTNLPAPGSLERTPEGTIKFLSEKGCEFFLNSRCYVVNKGTSTTLPLLAGRHIIDFLRSNGVDVRIEGRE